MYCYEYPCNRAGMPVEPTHGGAETCDQRGGRSWAQPRPQRPSCCAGARRRRCGSHVRAPGTLHTSQRSPVPANKPLWLVDSLHCFMACGLPSECFCAAERVGHGFHGLLSAVPCTKLQAWACQKLCCPAAASSTCMCTPSSSVFPVFSMLGVAWQVVQRRFQGGLHIPKLHKLCISCSCLRP